MTAARYRRHTATDAIDQIDEWNAIEIGEVFNETALPALAAQHNLTVYDAAYLDLALRSGAPIATIFRGLVQAGVDIPVATTDGNMTYAQMNQYAEFLPKQLYIPAAQWVMGYSPSIKLPEAEAAKLGVARMIYGAALTDGGAPRGR